MRIKMLKKQIQNDRIEKNLKVLKLLSNVIFQSRVQQIIKEQFSKTVTIKHSKI